MEDILILSEDGKTLLGVKDKSIREVVIPDGVEIIEENAFEYCHSLVSIEISNSVTSIGDSAFRDCSALITPYSPNSRISLLTPITTLGSPMRSMIPSTFNRARCFSTPWR